MNQHSEWPSGPRAMVVQKGTTVGEAWVLSLAWALTRVLGQGQWKRWGYISVFNWFIRAPGRFLRP